LDASTNDLSSTKDQNQLSKLLPGLIASDLSSIPDSLKVSTVMNLISTSIDKSKSNNLF
jgi:hypothetical protein